MKKIIVILLIISSFYIKADVTITQEEYKGIMDQYRSLMQKIPNLDAQTGVVLSNQWANLDKEIAFFCNKVRRFNSPELDKLCTQLQQNRK